MKTLILISVTMALSAIAHSKAPISEIRRLESAQSYKIAALQAAAYAHKVADSLRLDSIVEEVELSLTKQQKEVVTERHNQGAGFSLLGLIKGSAHLSYDVTQILTLNPQEVAQYSSKKARALKGLQIKLTSYLAKNESSIIEAKVFAAKALQLTAKLPVESIPEIQEYVTRTAQRVSGISFLGLVISRECLRVSHARTKIASGLKISGLLISLNLQGEEVRNAYEEMTCSENASEVEVGQSNIHSMELMIADMHLANQIRSLSLKLLNESSAPAYPTWDSPYID